MCVRTTHKCARSSIVTFRHLVSRDVSSRQRKPAQPSEGETLENQSHNYPDFHCHFKRKGRQNLAILAARAAGKRDIFQRRTNFVVKSALVPIPSADGGSLKGEDAQSQEIKNVCWGNNKLWKGLTQHCTAAWLRVAEREGVSARACAS